MKDEFWTTDLEDEPCDGCGVRPSKSAGHGSFTCKKCYDARWCPECHFSLWPSPHVCPSPEERQRRHIESSIMLLLLEIDGEGKAAEALRLAEELTREEPNDGPWLDTCPWCASITSTDGEHFDHKPDCKWKRFRDFFKREET